MPPTRPPEAPLAGRAESEAEIGEFLASAAVPADAMRQKLLSFLVHELRNPLASALWSAEMLARQQFTDSRTDRMAQLSARSVRRLRGMIEDLFALERLPAEPPRGSCDLRATLERALTSHDMDMNGVIAQVEGPEGISVAIHAGLLQRMLQACIRRAAHVREGGPVIVRVEAPGSLTIFRDGVSPEEMDPPLLQSCGSEGGGSTFALLFVRVAAQRAHVEFSVETTGTGTSIRLRFPVDHTSPDQN